MYIEKEKQRFKYQIKKLVIFFSISYNENKCIERKDRENLCQMFIILFIDNVKWKKKKQRFKYKEEIGEKDEETGHFFPFHITKKNV